MKYARSGTEQDLGLVFEPSLAIFRVAHVRNFRMMKRFPLLVLPFLVAATMGYGVRLASFDVSPDGRSFAISWQMDLEEDVREYELMRRTPYSNDQFIRVQAFKAHGTGRPYAFRDDQVYKAAADFVEYRLDAVYSNGMRESVADAKLNYTTTAVRRTWGSIKAMFQ